MDNKKIGLFIATQRKNKNLSQKQLAERINVTDKAISRWETGKGMPEVSLLQPLANELGVSLSELLNGELLEQNEASKCADQIIVDTMKKSNRKSKLLIVAISLVLVLSVIIGAISIGKSKPNTFENIPKTIVEQSENVDFNAVVSVPNVNSNSIYKYKSSYLVIDKELVFESLSRDKTIESKKENPSEDGLDLMNNYITFDDDSYLISGSANVIYKTPFAERISYVFHPYISYGHYASDGLYNADAFSKQQEFQFCSSKSANDKILDVLSKWNVDVYDNSQTYYLDNSVLEEQLKIVNAKTNGDYDSVVYENYKWNKNDDCYYFRYRQQPNEIPIFEMLHGNTDSKDLIVESNIEVLYSKNGIEMLNCNFLQSPIKNSKKKIDVITLDEAVNIIKQKYSNIQIDTKINISNIDFAYVPTNKSDDCIFDLIPCWIFKSEQVDADDEIITHYVIINAIDGSEIA